MSGWRFWEKREREPQHPGELEASETPTDSLVAALLGRSFTKADPHQLAAVEASAGLVARAFALAELVPATPATAAVTPALLSMAGRAFIGRGELVALIEADPMDGLTLHPASYWDVRGGYRPASWRYRVNLQGPSRVSTRSAASAEVVHLRINAEARAPWRGNSPITKAGLSAALAAQAEKALTGEAKIPSSRIAPFPGSKDQGKDSFTEDLRRGGITTIRAGGWQPSQDMQRGQDYQPAKVGPDPAGPMVNLRSEAAREVFAATGCPVELFGSSEGTAAREAWRRFMFGTVLPWGAVVAEELADKLDTPGLELKFDRLAASDISGRARAFQSMVGGGMDIERAAALAGLMAED